MSTEYIVFISNETIRMAIRILLPILGSAMAVGLTIAIIQATTSIQEITLTFIPKIAAVGFVLLFLMPWILNMLVTFTQNIFSQIPIILQ